MESRNQFCGVMLVTGSQSVEADRDRLFTPYTTPLNIKVCRVYQVKGVTASRCPVDKFCEWVSKEQLSLTASLCVCDVSVSCSVCPRPPLRPDSLHHMSKLLSLLSM